MQKLDYPVLGDFELGLGTIGPEGRDDINQKTYADMLARISNGEFNVPVEETVPVICVDGRLDVNDTRMNAPSIAGSTLGLAYARVLADNGTLADQTEKEIVASTIVALKEKNHTVNVHGDDHSDCGCGACAHCIGVFEHIVSHIEGLEKASEALGVALPASDTIVKNADDKLKAGFLVENRAEIISTGQDAGASYEKLTAGHNELAGVINTVPDTTIDRMAIREAFGDQYDVFVVDVWSFENGLKEAIGPKEDLSTALQASIVHNLATFSKLSHKSMPIATV